MMLHLTKLCILTPAIVAIGVGSSLAESPDANMLAADFDRQMLAMEDDLQNIAPPVAGASVVAETAPEQPTTTKQPADATSEFDADALIADVFTTMEREVGTTPAPETEPETVKAPENENATSEAAVELDPVEAITSSPDVVDSNHPKAGKIEELAVLEALRREAQRAHGLTSLQRAEEKMKIGDYVTARKRYEDALNDIPQSDPANRELARLGVAESHYRQGVLAYRQGDYKAAAQSARAAMGSGHPKAADLLYKAQNPPKPKPPEAAPPIWKNEKWVEQQRLLREKLIKAREYYAAREFQACSDELERILSDYPFNTEAKRLRQKLFDAVYDDKTFETDASRKKMMADVRDAWNPDRYAVDLEPVIDAVDPTSQRKYKEPPRQRMLKKLQQITLPKVEFREANINDVIIWIQEQSIENDKRENIPKDDRRGVDIVLKSGSGSSAAPAVGDEDPFNLNTAGGGGSKNSITLSATYISMDQVLEIVCDLAEMKWRVRGNVIMIVGLDEPEGDIIRREFDVMPGLTQRLDIIREESGGSGNNDPLGSSLSGASFEETGDLQGFFVELGVPFPAGSSIKYMPAVGKLFVANTADSLTILENVLYMINVTPRQIEIEARFVEVQQNDLESLGVEWLLNDDWEIAQNTSSGGSPWTQQRVVMQGNSGSGGFTTGQRFLSDLIGSGSTIGTADSLFRVTSLLTNPELSFVLHALDQKGNTDLLSAPKVVVKSGGEAEIKMVTEYIYPTEFDVTGLESTGTGANTGSSVVGAVVEPGDFETKEVGVILTVRPEVSAEGQMINLNIAPVVRSEPEWKNYGSRYIDSNGNPQELTMEQPFFSERSVRTDLSIYNGATVVMGGLITEVRIEVDDKIPFLGDIPFIGRLFRSTYESSEKRNLLIFVTARLVDPAGREVVRGKLSTAIAETEAGGVGE